MPTSQSVYGNYDRLEIEGSFDIDTAGAVTNVSFPAGVTATGRGDNISVSKTGAGTYVVTYKNSSAASALVVPLWADASVVPLAFGSGALGTAVAARVQTLTQPTSGTAQGDIQFTVITSATVGGAAANNGVTAETICFQVIFQTNRMGLAL